jgi:hypothetical protein
MLTPQGTQFNQQMLDLTNQFGAEAINDGWRKANPLPTGPDGLWFPFQLLSCDISADPKTISDAESALAFILGRYPAPGEPHPAYGDLNVYFPEGMSSLALYPAVSSTFTHTNGSTSEVGCFVPGAEVVIKDVVCVAPFVRPVKGDPRNCVKPCPVPAFTDQEYTQMW